MAFGHLLVTAVGVSIAGQLATFDNLSFVNSIGVPKLQSVVYAPAAQPENPVSVQFRSSKPIDVLNWLQSHGFSYVVNDGDLPADRTITLCIDNQPVSAVAQAVAIALGGHWEHAAGIHVFAKGLGPSSWMTVPNTPTLWSDGAPVASSKIDSDLGKLLSPATEDIEAMAFAPQGDRKLSDQAAKDLEKKLKDQFGPDFQKKMDDQFGPDFQKKMQDKFGPDFQKKMQDKFGPDFQKKMQDKFGPDFQKKMEDQFGPAFQKKMQDQFGPEFQKRMEKMAEDIEKSVEKNRSMFDSMPKSFGNGSGTNFFAPNSVRHGQSSISSGDGVFNPVRFMKTLTPAQKDEQRKQGHIWFSDLSHDQKAMFDNIVGKFDIDLKMNGSEIHVRRN